jgi:hypothetical protein
LRRIAADWAQCVRLTRGLRVANPNPSYVAIAVFIVLLGWRLYARIRRTIGRQRSSSVRPWITITALSSLSGLLALQSAAAPSSQLALSAGALVGVALGILGIRLTKFERTGDGLFYTPSAHLGIALTLLVAGRLAYRMAMLHGAPISSSPQVVQSPLTLALFGMLAGYYVSYAIGLIRWRTRALKESAAAPESSPPA